MPIIVLINNGDTGLVARTAINDNFDALNTLLEAIEASLVNFENTADGEFTFTDPITGHTFNLHMGLLGTNRSLSIPDATGVIVLEDNTATLSMKRIQLRDNVVASSSTPTPSADADDGYCLTALAENATFGAPTGAPTNLQELVIRIKDNGTPRTLAWNAIYRAGNMPLPQVTIASQTLYLKFIFNGADTRWDFVSEIGGF